MDDELFLNERVKVLTAFADGMHPCRPIKFVRSNGREVQVSEIGLAYPTTKGSRTLHVFDVTDGQADYRLEFDSFSLTWHLTREADHV